MQQGLPIQPLWGPACALSPVFPTVVKGLLFCLSGPCAGLAAAVVPLSLTCVGKKGWAIDGLAP